MNKGAKFLRVTHSMAKLTEEQKLWRYLVKKFGNSAEANNAFYHICRLIKEAEQKAYLEVIRLIMSDEFDREPKITKHRLERVVVKEQALCEGWNWFRRSVIERLVRELSQLQDKISGEKENNTTGGK